MSRLDTAVLSLRITAIVVALWGLGSLSLALGASQLYGSKFEDLPATLDADYPVDSEGAGYPPPSPPAVKDSHSDTLSAFYLYPGFTCLAFAGLLYLLSRRLARAWFPPEQEPASPRLDTYGVQAVAFSVVGLFLLMTTLPSLISSLAWMFLPFGDAGLMPGSPFGMEGPGGLLVTLLEAAFGFVLFLGSRRLAARWHRKAGWISRETS
ncbi:MAG: hypothetical protein ISR76_07205 [Planctomycetes bacterium]|nr:hypothetical protein [Planctomycetota bacterium]MBL7008769.1 hypothetical protein [Planctomycetota bacterium]